MVKRQKKKITAGANKSAPVLFLTTFDSRDEAHKFAKALLNQRLAACVNVLPHIASFYRWQGELHEDLEILVIGKTTSPQFKTLKTRIKILHPYKLPELISFKITDGLPEYLKWITDSLE